MLRQLLRMKIVTQKWDTPTAWFIGWDKQVNNVKAKRDEGQKNGPFPCNALHRAHVVELALQQASHSRVKKRKNQTREETDGRRTLLDLGPVRFQIGVEFVSRGGLCRRLAPTSTALTTSILTALLTTLVLSLTTSRAPLPTGSGSIAARTR